VTPDLAARVAARLGHIDGVTAVVLGGSQARGDADAYSDIDLGIYYRPARRPALAALRRLAEELDDRHPPDAVTDFGAWGPWINGGAWLVIEGRRVDWLFSDLDLVERTIADCQAGRPACDYQIGHPHAFHGHMVLAQVHYGRALHDPDSVIAALKARVAQYPPLLRRALVDGFLFEAGFALEGARKSVARGDVFHVAGAFFRAVACLVQVLFAQNERYFLNEKGAGGAVAGFALCPPGFADTVAAVLGRPGDDPAALAASLARLEELVDAVRDLCSPSASSS